MWHVTKATVLSSTWRELLSNRTCDCSSNFSKGKLKIRTVIEFRKQTDFLLVYFVRDSGYSVGCLWHFHGKNPVWLYPKLQSQPIGLRKIFIDYLFFQADQSDCTKSVSIFNRFASSEERWNQNVSCQICRAWVFPLVVWDGLLTSKILRDTGK